MYLVKIETHPGNCQGKPPCEAVEYFKIFTNDDKSDLENDRKADRKAQAKFQEKGCGCYGRVNVFKLTSVYLGKREKED